MDKLFVFFVIALFANGVYGQGGQPTEEDLEDRYGWDRPNWNQRPNRFPNNQNPGWNQLPGWNQIPGWNNNFPGQNTFPTPNPNTAPTPAPTTGPTTQSPAVRQCMNACIVTSEYNPVCGTDNVTYNNPGRLTCAQQCGVNVSLLRTSPCPTPPPVDSILD